MLARNYNGNRMIWLSIMVITVVIGIALRWYQAGIQVLIDDEWHAIHMALRSGFIGIFTHFGHADHSIPMTVYFRWLYDRDMLSEWSMRLPMLIASSALLVIAPLLLRDLATYSTRALWTILLALSPLMVYLGKTARPYALTSFFTFVSIIAFYRWWKTQSGWRIWAISYVIATFIAGYLHPLTLVFTLSPFIYYGVSTLRDLCVPLKHYDSMYALGRLLRLGIVTALLLGIALLPPFMVDAASLVSKAGTDTVTIESIWRTALMLFGISNPWLGILFILMLSLGGYSLWRCDRGFTGYIGLVIFVGVTVIALVRPAWIQHPLVYARYVLPILPFLLLFVAEGVMVLLDRLQVHLLAATVVVLLGVGLVIAGPLPAYLYNPNQFMGHAKFQFDYDPRENPYFKLLPAFPIPQFYFDLAQKPAGSVTLIEMPWRLESNFILQPWYQAVHRQYVKMGLVTPVCGEHSWGEYPETTSGTKFTQFAHLSAILRGETYGADYLVIHPHPMTIPRDLEKEWYDLSACLPQIEQQLGPAAYRDDEIIVYSLDKSPSSNESLP